MDATFMSLGQPTGFNAGLYMSQYTDGDSYVVTRTYTASNGSCYDGMMFVRLAPGGGAVSCRFAPHVAHRWHEIDCRVALRLSADYAPCRSSAWGASAQVRGLLDLEEPDDCWLPQRPVSRAPGLQRDHL